MNNLITIIGRGHSGTRAISHTLSASDVFMGEPLNKSGDLLPPQAMYDACRVMARHVRWLGGLAWDFSQLHTMEIPQEFTDLIQSYLTTVLESPAANKGWKIPETTLVFPWILRMFPDVKYILWVRNPRDCILRRHKTDDLADFGIEYPATDDERQRRAISWKYQYDLIKATPKPRHWLEVRFEDFVLNQNETIARLEDYLGFKVAKIPVMAESIGRWKMDDGISYYDFLGPMMQAYDYETPPNPNGSLLTEDERQACIRTLAQFPAELAELVTPLSETQLTTKTLADEWTVAQIVHHLADSHMNSVIRLKLVLTEDHPPLKPYDQEAWANLPDGSNSSIAQSLAILEGLHARWVTIWQSLSEGDWRRTGLHPEMGVITVEELLQGYDQHCRDHLAQIKRVLAAG